MAVKPELLDKLNWLAEKHITREYRTTTINEDDAKQILAALKAAPEIAGAKIIEALIDAEEIMHAYFFPVNWCIDCGAHVDGFHETGCLAGSILGKHRKIIGELSQRPAAIGESCE